MNLKYIPIFVTTLVFEYIVAASLKYDGFVGGGSITLTRQQMARHGSLTDLTDNSEDNDGLRRLTRQTATANGDFSSRQRLTASFGGRQTANGQRQFTANGSQFTITQLNYGSEYG